MAYVTSTTNRWRRRCGGFTLLEATVACVVLALAVLAISATLTSTVKQSLVVEEDANALLLARQLIEEIASKPFTDPVTGTAAPSDREASRAAYNNVGDYDGYTDTIDLNHPVTQLQSQTTPMGGGRSYVRTVSVHYRTTPTGPNASSGNFALVTVTVTTPYGRPVVINHLAANFNRQQN